MSKYICYNGEFVRANEFLISPDNRAFNYGDGIFESIRCNNSQPFFFDKHYQRLRNALYQLEIELPKEYTEEYFRHNIYRLLQKNRIYKGARIRLTIFRADGGLFGPSDNTARFVLSAKPLEFEEFVLNPVGLNIGIFKNICKPLNIFSPFKTNNALIYVLAAKWKSDHEYDDALIVNTDGFIIEGVSSNVFCVIKGKLVTPAIESGCVNGIMRSVVFELASELKIPVVETLKLNEKVIGQADEIFFTNAVQGIFWTVSYQERRYYHFVASKLLKALNESIRNIQG
jgi:branched-subunit amino acid aminotransferase/4-amino-4-deoxychorismate lyase